MLKKLIIPFVVVVMVPLSAQANPFAAAVLGGAMAAAKKRAASGKVYPVYRRTTPYQNLSSVRVMIATRKPLVRQVVAANKGPVEIFRNRDNRLLVTASGRFAYQSLKKPKSKPRRVWFGWQISQKKFSGLSRDEVSLKFLEKFVYASRARQ